MKTALTIVIAALLAGCGAAACGQADPPTAVEKVFVRDCGAECDRADRQLRALRQRLEETRDTPKADGYMPASELIVRRNALDRRAAMWSETQAPTPRTGAISAAIAAAYRTLSTATTGLMQALVDDDDLRREAVAEYLDAAQQQLDEARQAAAQFAGT